MNLRSLTLRMSMLAGFGLLFAAFAAGQSKDQTEIRKEGLQLIGQVQEAARDIRYNADRLSSFTRSMTLTKWTHYHHLTEIRSLVNDGLQPALQRLTEIQSQLPEWHQQSIDNMLSAAKDLAADANSAILNKKDAGAVPPVLNAEYKDLITKIYQHADNLVKLAGQARTDAAAKSSAALIRNGQ